MLMNAAATGDKWIICNKPLTKRTQVSGYRFDHGREVLGENNKLTS